MTLYISVCGALVHGASVRVQPVVAGRAHPPLRGGAVQVDPIKRKLKPPRTKRLKLKIDELLLKFVFNSNLHRNIGAFMTTLALCNYWWGDTGS